MKHKKLILLPLLALLLGCNGGGIPEGDPEYTLYEHSAYNAAVDQDGYTLIDFYALNDFHGALERNVADDEPGIGALSTYLKNERNENPGGTVFIANGDMWQGSTDSNITRGKIVNHTLNHLGFASFTLGNHEFDWGIDLIRENKTHSNFPYLGENILFKDSEEQVDFIDESPLIERDGVKIGIIGTMGSDLINTIQASFVEDIEFDKITEYVKVEADRLRDIGANIVILAAHDTWANNLTPERNELLEDNVIDAVFTGHQHVKDEQLVNGIPILQTIGRGRQAMHVQFGYHKTNNDLKLIDYDVVEDLVSLPLAKDATAEKIYDHYARQYETAKVKNEVIGRITGEAMNESAVANLTVEVMTKAYEDEGAVGAIHNVNGGIRATFPLGKITYNQVYKALPFDNEIYIVSLSASRLRALMDVRDNYATYFNIAYADVQSGTFYKVVTISFVFEMNNSPFTGISNYENQFIYTRDLVAEHIRSAKTIDGRNYL